MGGVKNNSKSSTYILTFSDNNLFSKQNLNKILYQLKLGNLSTKIQIINNTKGLNVYITCLDFEYIKIKKIIKNSLSDVFFKKIELKDNFEYLTLGLKKHFSIPLILGNKFNLNEIILKDSLFFKSEDYFAVSLNIKPYRSVRPYLLRQSIVHGNKYHFRLHNPLLIPSYIFRIYSRIYRVLNNSNKLKYINDENKIAKLDKLYSNLFRVEFRISSNHKNTINNYIGLINSQSNQKISLRKLDKFNNIFSDDEISSILEFPDNDEILSKIKLEQIKHIQPSNPFIDENNLKLGKNIKFQNKIIGINHQAREKHLLVLGSTGTGKSTLFKNMINQDIENGRGLTLIDPHGDLAREIYQSNHKVLYLDPIKSNVRINLLERKYSKTDYRYIFETEKITENVISVLSKLFSNDDQMGHKIEFVLRNACYLALEQEKANLFTIFKILNDGEYRNSLLRNTNNSIIKNYWNNEFNKAGDYQRVKLISGITSKIGRLINSPILGNIFNSYKSNINFEDIIMNRKILICNLSKGSLGEHTSSLLGGLIIAKLQLAAYSMSAISMHQRSKHFLYIDESQNFANSTMMELISEARKYHLYLNLSQQSLSQQSEEFNNILLANVGNIIAFRSSSPSDNRQLSALFSEIPESQLLNLPSYNFYLRNVTGLTPQIVNGEVLV